MIRTVLVGLVLVHCLMTARADPFHNINQIVGDRAIGMAGAYGGVSDDASGMVYNPAGIAFSGGANISANVNTLQYNQIDYQDVLNGEVDYQRQAAQLLPNFFGVVQPLGEWTLGFSSAIVDSTEEKQDQSFQNFGNIERFTVNLNNLSTTYNVGPTLSRRINRQLAIGLSLPMHYQSFELINNQFIDFNDAQSTEFQWQNLYLKGTEFGVRPKLGVSFSPRPKWSIGVTVDQTYVLSANQSEQFARCDAAAAGCDDATQVNPEIRTFSDIQRYPVAVRFGSAWFASNALLVSADLIYHSSVTQSSDAFFDKTDTLDGALGAEWYWSPQWALRSGVYTSYASTPELNPDSVNQAPHIDRYGATLSVARFTQTSSLSLGLLGRYGVGESQLVADSTEIQQTTDLDITLFFSTSYRY